MDVPQDKEDIQLYEYHGMADIYDQLLKMNGDGPKNGWATLGCLQGAIHLLLSEYTGHL